jgi:hypothetical protein
MMLKGEAMESARNPYFTRIPPPEQTVSLSLTARLLPDPNRRSGDRKSGSAETHARASSGGSCAVVAAMTQLRVGGNLLFREQPGGHQVRAKVNPAQLPTERGDAKDLFA